MSFRVALAGFLHETNTFAPSKARFEDFAQGGGYMPLAQGQAIPEQSRGINLGISGAVSEAEAQGWDMVPLLWAGAIPSAHVTQAAYDRISSEILRQLQAAGPVDGVFLDLHGAMVAEDLDDGEGDFLARVRRLVGPDVPIAAALDLHGNISRQMVDAADVLVGFRTYPHVDMADTGARAARLLGSLMQRRRGFAKAFRQLPFLVPIAWQCTDTAPARGLYDLVVASEGTQVHSASFFFGFPAADIPDCGPSLVCYGESQADAEAAADRIEAAVLAAEPEFKGQSYAPDAGVLKAMELAGSATRPIVIADTQDNPGAGGDSNTTGMLRALHRQNAKKAALGNLVDARAAQAAHSAGVGAVIDIALGGSPGVAGDAPFEGRFTVEALSDGRFVATGPFYGDAPLDLGPSACLRIGDVRVVVTTHKAQMASQAMYRQVGIEPTEQAILINKSSVHFRADFAPIAAEILVCTAPGPMPLSPASLPFTRLRTGLRVEPLGPGFVPSPQPVEGVPNEQDA